jgi:hypothetical protein
MIQSRARAKPYVHGIILADELGPAVRAAGAELLMIFEDPADLHYKGMTCLPFKRGQR